MIDPFKANMILDKIKKVFNVDIDFINIDEKYFNYILYKYQFKEITEFEDKTVEIEISKDDYKSRIAFNINELFYYKFDLFENILLSTVFNFYKHIYDNEDDKANKFLEIAKSKDLTVEMFKEYEKYKKLYELAQLDEINTIKNNVYYAMLTFAIPKAMEWLHILKTEKINKRRRYEEKDSYEYLCSTVSKQLCGINIQITEIREWFGKLAWSILFDYNGKTFYITVPNMDNLDIKLYKEYSQGKIYLGYYENECSINCIETSYLEEDIKKAFMKFNNIEKDEFNEV